MLRFSSRACKVAAAAASGLFALDCSSPSEAKAVMKSWGSGQFGQLGLGTERDEASPQTVEALASGPTFVCAGGSSTAVIDENGQVHTFGNGTNGRLGHGAGHFGHQSVPALIKTDTKFKHVAIGEYHMCGLTGIRHT